MIIDKMVYINRSCDIERNESSKTLFKKHGLKVERVEGVDGNTVEASNELPRGYNGLTKTLIGIVKSAKENSLKNILIFEDDNEFLPDFNSRLDEALNNLPEDFGVLYLSCLSSCEFVPVSGNVFEITAAIYGNAFLLNNTMFDAFLFELEKYELISDMALIKSVRDSSDLKAYSILPCIAWQKKGYSTVLKAETDNSKIGELKNYHPMAGFCDN